MSTAEGRRARRAAVVGLGLIGSSVAMALRNAGYHVSGSDIDHGRELRAEQLGAIDAIGNDDEADLGIVATPVAAIGEVASTLFKRSRRADLVVTDVGGVKAPIVGRVAHPRFVGGHPMAGSEQEGPDGADPEIFIGASWVLTPVESTETTAFGLVRDLVGELGAEAVVLSPERHDAVVAVVSHVPHLAAANLMALAADASNEHGSLMRLAAGGFRDMTRIAAGDPAIWPDIFDDNADAVLEVLDGLVERLEAARALIAARDRPGLMKLLEYAKSARRNLPPRVLRPESIVECRVPVLDRPGALAEVTTTLYELGVNVWDIEIAHSAEGERGVLVLSVNDESAETARAALAAKGFRPAIRRFALPS